MSTQPSGEGGIRTHEPFQTAGFQDQCTRPTMRPLHFTYMILNTIFDYEPNFVDWSLYESQVFYNNIYMILNGFMISSHIQNVLLYVSQMILNIWDVTTAPQMNYISA